MTKEQITREVKRVCPEALNLASRGGDPAHLSWTKGVRMKKNIRKLLTKYSKMVFHEK